MKIKVLGEGLARYLAHSKHATMIFKIWTGKSLVSCIEPEPAQTYQGGQKVVEHCLINKMYGLDVKIRIWTELS